MKYFGILLLLAIGFSTNGLAQEKYFHDLRGFEDSTGTTHLFYRMMDHRKVDCYYYDFESDSYIPSTTSVRNNNIYHLNTRSEIDSLKFKDNTFLYPDCYSTTGGVLKYLFASNHPDSTLEIEYLYGGLFGGYSFNQSESTYLELGLGNPLGMSYEAESNSIVFTSQTFDLVIKATDDYTKAFGSSFRYMLGDSAWSSRTFINEIPDSLFIDFLVMGINPLRKNQYVGYRDSTVVISDDYGATYTPIAKHNWELYNIYGTDEPIPQIPTIDRTVFDADSNSFYIIFLSDAFTNSLPNSMVYLVREIHGIWVHKSISEGYDNFSFALDYSRSGSYFYSDEYELYQTSDFGINSTLVETFSDPVTGIYKKPNSNFIYALTSKELIELNVDTRQKMVIKVLPVSNEEQAEIPTSITLSQNYPNPFNPSTKIQFAIPLSSHVRLVVYDQLGRELQVMIDDFLTVGNHVATFNANNYSSGIYYYMMEATDLNQRIIKKMTLIK